MEKLKNLKYLKWVIIAVLLVAIGIGTGFGVSKYINEATVTKLHFEDVGELATQSAYVTSVSDYQNEPINFVIDIPFTQSKAIYSYSTTIKAGFDFADIVVDVDEDLKLISVTLPEVRILSIQIDRDSFKLYYEDQNAFHPLTVEDFNKSNAELEAIAEEEAIEQGLLDNARTNGELLIKNFIGNVYDLNVYTVQFK